MICFKNNKGRLIMLKNTIVVFAIFLFSLISISCHDDNYEKTFCQGELEITFLNQRSEDIYITYTNMKISTNENTIIEFMDTTSNCLANESTKNIVFYTFGHTEY